MVATDRVMDIFADARHMHAAALSRLDAGDIRAAAEKAWCATKRATDALILARTGHEPEKSPRTTIQVRALASQDSSLQALVDRYASSRDFLHGDCFYLGLCDPVDDTERRIRDTDQYIRDAENLASYSV